MVTFTRKRFLIAAVGYAILTGCQSADKKPAKSMPRPQALTGSISQKTTPPPQGMVQLQPQVSVQPQTSLPKPDPVAELIEKAEKEYQAGQDNYSTGHLESARTNFDNAVNILWQGPVDIKSDDRLQREFDKIIEGVHELEMVALQQGDGFTERRSEPAPIDAINDVTFPSDPAITAKAQEELKSTVSDLPLVINDYVAGYINFFSTRGKSTLANALVRAGRYRDMINRIFRKEGVPQDLLYLAQAESGFHPLALSRVGARGMWQFMSYSMSGFGLKKSWWLDERQDPEKSTQAAAKYLKMLYEQFGDWYLAMAAYDSGAGVIQRGVQRTGYADFWELYKRGVLPKETKNYVPIIIAMAIMAKNPSQYGLDALQPETSPAVEKVKIDYPVDLRLVAEIIDIPVEDLLKLNPALLRLTTPKDMNFELTIPAGNKDKFEQTIAQIPHDKRISWRFHKVAAGESLSAIGRKYHATPAAIAEVNGIDRGDELKIDAKLIIPVSSARTLEARQSSAYAKAAVRYKVRKGDTVLTVADQFSVPPEMIRRWNRLKGNNLHSGRYLTIHRPLGPNAPPMSGERLVRSSSKRRRSGAKSKPHAAANRKSTATLQKAPSTLALPTQGNHGVTQTVDKK